MMPNTLTGCGHLPFYPIARWQADSAAMYKSHQTASQYILVQNRKTESKTTKQICPADTHIFPHAAGVIIPIRQHICHRWASQPPNDMHDLPQQRCSRDKCPCNMINQHGDDDQIFQFISIEGMQFHSCKVPFRSEFLTIFPKKCNFATAYLLSASLV